MAMNRGGLLAASAGLMGCALIWGSMTPILKQLTTSFDLWLLSSMRYRPGVPVLWLAWWLVRRPGGAKRPARIGVRYDHVRMHFFARRQGHARESGEVCFGAQPVRECPARAPSHCLKRGAILLRGGCHHEQ